MGENEPAIAAGGENAAEVVDAIAPAGMMMMMMSEWIIQTMPPE